MPNRMSYSKAQANLASICERVTADHEVIIINRRGAEDVALVAASELSGLLETAHLLRSPQNAQRLLKALNRARKSAGQTESPAQLRREIGLAPTE